jgi:hypothetical protein
MLVATAAASAAASSLCVAAAGGRGRASALLLLVLVLPVLPLRLWLPLLLLRHCHVDCSLLLHHALFGLRFVCPLGLAGKQAQELHHGTVRLQQDGVVHTFGSSSTWQHQHATWQHQRPQQSPASC